MAAAEIPTALRSQGWVLQEPPAPQVDGLGQACHGGLMPGCSWECMVPFQMRAASLYFANM